MRGGGLGTGSPGEGWRSRGNRVGWVGGFPPLHSRPVWGWPSALSRPSIPTHPPHLPTPTPHPSSTPEPLPHLKAISAYCTYRLMLSASVNPPCTHARGRSPLSPRGGVLVLSGAAGGWGGGRRGVGGLAGTPEDWRSVQYMHTPGGGCTPGGGGSDAAQRQRSTRQRAASAAARPPHGWQAAGPTAGGWGGGGEGAAAGLAARAGTRGAAREQQNSTSAEQHNSGVLATFSPYVRTRVGARSGEGSRTASGPCCSDIRAQLEGVRGPGREACGWGGGAEPPL